MVIAWTGVAIAEMPREAVFENLGSRDGLSHNSINAILQDRQGFLWVGTQDGLNRFDGLDFQVWYHDAADPRSLSSNNVKALLEDRRGTLWVGTDQGLDRFDRFGRAGGTFERLPFPAPLGEAGVRTLFEDREGVVWAGLDSGGLLRYLPSKDRLQLFRHDPAGPESLAPGEVYAIQQDGAGALWILTGRGPESRERRAVLQRFAPGSRQAGRATGGGFEKFPTPKGWDVRGFLIDRSGRFWMNVPGIGTFDPQTGRFQAPLTGEGFLPLGGLWEARDGSLWISTYRGFLRYRPVTGPITGTITGPFPSAAEADRLSGFAEAFAEDPRGISWLGTRGGLYKWDRHRKPFHHLHRRGADATLTSDRISAVLVDASGTLWVGTFGAGLNRFDDLESPSGQYGNRPRGPGNLCSYNAWHLAEDREGTLWVGINHGLCRYDRGADRFVPIPLHVPEVEGGVGSVRYIAVAPGGKLWLASEIGLLSYQPGAAGSGEGTLRWHGSPEEDGPGRGLIHTLLLEGGTKEGEGRLWLGTQGGGLEELDLATGIFTRHPLEIGGRRLRSEGIFAIVPAGQSGALWLGSAAGLSHYDPATGELLHYEARDGLPGSSVYSILEDDESRLWLGTNQGLSRFDPELPPGSRFRSFDVSDGIGSLEFNRHAAHRGPDGRFYFGGMNGLTSFFPEQIRDNPVIPPVALTRVRIWTRDGESAFDPGDLEELVLSPRESSFAIEYAALDFTNADHSRYAYRLEGFDDGWVDNGTRRFARYHRVPPGRYDFHVKGSNGDGLWNAEGAVLGVRILPPFWQSWWFRLLLLGVAAAALFAFHRARLRRHLEIEKLRTRIAGDLHDDLSSELSGMALAMELMQETESDPSHRQRLGQVRERALDLVDRLRDIVWCVNPEHDDLHSLVRRMRTVAQELVAEEDLRFEASPALGGELPLAVRRNLLLIYKEALHNAARHSRARQIRVRLGQEGGHLVLEVADDGIGFEEHPAEDGFGLANLHRRAEEMGATVAVTSRPGAGTEVRLEIPRRQR